MIAETTFAVVGLLFLLADLRAVLSTIYHSLYLGLGLPNAIVGGVAFAVLGTSILALAVARLGPRRSVTASGLVLAIATILATVSRAQWLDLVLGTVAIGAGTVWLALFHASRRPAIPSPLPLALPLALVIDVSLRAASGTVSVLDLPLAPSLAIVVAASLLFLATGLTALAAEREWTVPSWRGAVGLMALPSLLLVADTGGLNAAQLAGAAGLGLGPETPGSTERAALLVGLAAAVALVALAIPAGRATLIAAVTLAGGAALLWLRIPILSLVGGGALGGGVILAASLLPRDARPATWPAGTVLALTSGWLLMTAAAFAHYAFYDYLPALAAATALTVLAVGIVPAIGDRLPRAPLYAAAAAALLVPLLALVTVPPAAQAAPLTSFRLMTWNVNQGFDADQVADLDGIVETIARENPDVIVLQEVTRGWVINERHDLLSVVAGRLGMTYAFGPQIGDLYGNAILSRLPIEEVDRVHFPKEPGLRHQPRGALLARVGGVLLVATHLEHNRDAGRVREEQVLELLKRVGDRSPALIAGDLNASSASPELAPLARAGFVDLAASIGAREDTFPADRPTERIDYVFGIGVRPAQAHVVATRAADHRPLVMNITPIR